jgi:hypothetical protein
MIARRSHRLLPVLVAAIFLVLAGHGANAATLQAEAQAVIRSGIAVRSTADSSEPMVKLSSASRTPVARMVMRPCRPNDPLSTEQCRIQLFELQ